VVAAAASTGWVHEHGSPSGAFSLGGEDARELCPARIKDRSIEPAFRGGHVRQEHPRLARVWFRRGAASHGGCVELFERDHVAGVHQPARGLVVEVAPPAADFAPLLREGPPQPLAIPRSTAGAFFAPLQGGDRLCRGG
jgi:hypothetical protein